MQKLSELILSDYQIRKTRKQKTKFIELLQTELKDKSITIEQGGLTRARNIIVGDLENAEFVLGAHYDTQPVLPFPNFLTPKNLFIYIMYMLAVFVLFFLITGLSMTLIYLFTDDPAVASIISRIILGILLLATLFGPANKHTANDNTSGIITLIEALHDEDIAQKAAFVFFDQEELGLFGSSYFAKKHKQIMKEKLLINFDCVSDGDHMMIILNKAAKKSWHMRFTNAFAPTDEKTVIITDASNTLYPSDQMNFKCSAGVAAFKKNKLFGYYMDRIHTPKDTIFDKRNIELLIQGLKSLSKPQNETE